ncbi:MAG: response regulator transcription factor [Alphaproteobacteria bacterium]|nr:response regulator transcription factor [Rhizobiaceae bacterium]MBU3963891.1 response regulator transcription factor [Alphaproteobacteria bacterium]MBU4051598.1 response regulator transcription factor [Alphaproteobacteria bacterium]MBU4087117.1 response regulator transcription factor [Alphaproteobacteria bacterium]MBU4156353.1 response regulator transcription factor [Alphaproteobacteria bacterium]
MRLLVVEDDEVLSDGLKVGLNMLGFTVDAVGRVADACEAVAVNRFDAIVLDLMLPDGSGLDVLAQLRASGGRTPVLLLTARDEVGDRIAGLDAGADDYLGKPFDLDELAARLRAIIRRAQGRAESRPQWRGVTLDPARMSAEQDGRTVPLSRREFTILQALMDNPGTIQSKTALEQKLYGWQEDVESNTVEVHVHKIRAKLGAELIETVRGVGYRLKDEAP